MRVNYGGKSFVEAAQNRYRPVIEMYISGLFESKCQLKAQVFTIGIRTTIGAIDIFGYTNILVFLSRLLIFFQNFLEDFNRFKSF